MTAEVRQESQAVKAPDGPISSDQIVPTLAMFAVAAAGGFVAFYRKWKEGHVRSFNVTELIGEMMVSGICGVLAYWACTGLGVNPWMTAFAAGVVGHMGSRFMFLAEQWMGRKAGIVIETGTVPQDLKKPEAPKV